jgi:hypothetical protein
MKPLAIDPGSENSGFVVCDSDTDAPRDGIVADCREVPRSRSVRKSMSAI